MVKNEHLGVYYNDGLKWVKMMQEML